MGTRKRDHVPKLYSRDGVRRHVWIYGGIPAGERPWTGLLLEWQHRGDEWWGRVVFVPTRANRRVTRGMDPKRQLSKVAQEPYPPERL